MGNNYPEAFGAGVVQAEIRDHFSIGLIWSGDTKEILPVIQASPRELKTTFDLFKGELLRHYF